MAATDGLAAILRDAAKGPLFRMRLDGPRLREDDVEMVEALGVLHRAQCSEAVRNTNDVVTSVAVAEPVNWSQSSPICGSSVKVMAIAACGLTK
jgi:hypothetical protein